MSLHKHSINIGCQLAVTFKQWYIYIQGLCHCSRFAKWECHFTLFMCHCLYVTNWLGMSFCSTRVTFCMSLTGYVTLQYSYVSLALSKDHVLAWIQQLKSVLLHCCSYFKILKVRLKHTHLSSFYIPDVNWLMIIELLIMIVVQYHKCFINNSFH